MNQPVKPGIFCRIHLLIVATSLCQGCPLTDDKPDPFDRELVVLTRNAPTTYYFDKEGELAGFEYELAKSFAQYIGKPIKFVELESTSEILESLQANRAHLAAAGLTKTVPREDLFSFGPEYMSLEQQVVCKPRLRVLSVPDLVQKDLKIPQDTSYIETLTELQDDIPALNWEVAENTTSELLLERVANDQLDCTVIDSSIFRIVSNSLPKLRVNFSIGNTQFLAWPLAPRAESLRPQLKAWFDKLASSGTLKATIDRHFGHAQDFDYYDLKVFRQRIKTVLPNYLNIIRTAAKETGFSADLLAAVAYQESHWNPKSRSATGVRGFMMLTQITAQSLGVDNRLDPTQSMLGGARYLKQLFDRLPSFIPSKDRLWMAMAAYNVGLGHLQDARRLAVSENLNPNAWIDVRRVLPLLAKPEYYKDTRYGYARGYEPVSYVRRVRQYRAILEQELQRI